MSYQWRKKIGCGPLDIFLLKGKLVQATLSTGAFMSAFVTDAKILALCAPMLNRNTQTGFWRKEKE